MHFAASLLVLMRAAVCFDEEAAGITHCLFVNSFVSHLCLSKKPPRATKSDRRLDSSARQQVCIDSIRSLYSELHPTKTTMPSIWEMASRIAMPEEIRVIHHGNAFACLRRILRLPECRVVFAFCLWVLLLWLAACHYKRFTLTPFFRMVNRNFA